MQILPAIKKLMKKHEGSRRRGPAGACASEMEQPAQVQTYELEVILMPI